MPDSGRKNAQLVHLVTCADQHEAALVRSLLAAHELDCVVQGEQHRSMLGMLGAYIEPRVLVHEADLARATELLRESGNFGTTEEGGTAGDEEVCAVHEQAAAMKCQRCGASLCDQCQVADRAKPVCEACDEAPAAAIAAKETGRRAKGWVVLAIVMGPLLLMGAIALLTD